MYEKTAAPSSDRGPGKAEVTQLLLQWRQGDHGAAETLTPLIYQELHRLAHSYMLGERRPHLLQTTALVHEAFIRLAEADIDWRNRRHFFAVSAQLMRRVLVDYARKHRAAKRGGGAPVLQLQDFEIPAERPDDFIALDDALCDLSKLDRRKARVLELRYFGGMDTAEIASVIEISPRSVERDLHLGRAWIADALRSRA